MVTYVLRKFPVLWRVYKYYTNHPFLCVLSAIGLTLIGLYAVRTRGFLDDSKDRDVDYIADYVNVRLQVVDNFRFGVDVGVPMEMTLRNTGSRDIMSGKWRIYFNSLSGEVSEHLTCGLQIQHVIGGLYYVSPILEEESVSLIPARSSISCMAHHGVFSISRTDHMPNWYVTMGNGTGYKRIVQSTASEDLSHIGEFKKSNQWKRNTKDLHDPYTPIKRFGMNSRFNEDSLRDTDKVLPTPQTINIVPSNRVEIKSDWVIQDSVNFRNEVRYLSNMINIKIEDSRMDKRVIQFLPSTNKRLTAEEYNLQVTADYEKIIITADEPSGAFYGAQTLIALLREDRTVPSVTIADKPRFHFRGLMVDVARNFRSKETIKKLLDAMATYKLNKLHLHLSDDEGWRLQIPGIPELTDVGSKRCHSNTENVCLSPSLGSGPFTTSSGSGYYSVFDYKEILKYAAERHVQVIPEIDMPGHAMAAVVSMNFRESFKDEHGASFTSYLLNDDVSAVTSVQNWAGNSMNPCLNSTYAFVKQIMDTLIELHKGIQDLTIFHIGGDEVPQGVWDNSKACQTLFGNSAVSHADVKKLFVYSVTEMAAKRGLNIGSWEDGMYQEQTGPFKRSGLKAKEIYVNPWDNRWEANKGGRAYEFADAGYKVVLTLGTVLYFDHPYEPDPEERGLYWATRYTDTESVFAFLPDDVFANAVRFSSGELITKEDVCGGRSCPSTNKPENIVGIQACIWGELVRTEEQFFEMLFPRLLAVAERSWHKAPWEDIKSVTSRDSEKLRDFTSFVNHLGHKELPRLEKSGIPYRLPIPGAKLSRDKVDVNVMYPNHKIMYSTWNKNTWYTVKGTSFKYSKSMGRLFVKSMSNISGRSSRAILVSNMGVSTLNADSFHITLVLLILVSFIPVFFDKYCGIFYHFL